MQRLKENTPKQKMPAILFGIRVAITQQTAANAQITMRDVFLFEANLDMITLTMLKNTPDVIVVRTSGSSIVLEDDLQDI